MQVEVLSAVLVSSRYVVLPKTISCQEILSGPHVSRAASLVETALWPCFPVPAKVSLPTLSTVPCERK